MTGCPLLRACFDACRFGELSQQRVPPHCWQVRRWTQREPIFTPSSHSPRCAVFTSLTVSMWGQACSLMQHLMDEGDGDRAFADRRRDAFDVSGAHVADREDAREAGFQEMRRA